MRERKGEGKETTNRATTHNLIDDECGKIFHRSIERVKNGKSSLSKPIAQWIYIHVLFFFVGTISVVIHFIYCQLFANLPTWFISWPDWKCWMNEHIFWWMNYSFSFCSTSTIQTVEARAGEGSSRQTLTHTRVHIRSESLLIWCTYLNLWEFRSGKANVPHHFSNKRFCLVGSFPSLARAPHPNQLICLTVYHQPLFSRSFRTSSIRN